MFVQNWLCFYYPLMKYQYSAKGGMAASDLLSDKLKSTGASLFTKAVGRETKPAWGNRLLKDFYDLDYDIPTPLPKLQHKYHLKSPQNNRKTTTNNNHSALDRTKVQGGNYTMILSQSKRHLSKRKKLTIFDKYTSNPQIITLEPDSNSSDKFLGLSPYQYQNTIQGRIQRKSNHHLSFQKNKISRIVNENPIYYDRNQDINLSHSRTIEKKRMIDMQHHFGSKTQRKTFEPRDQLDKFYDTDEGYKAVSPNHSEGVRKFDTVLQRKEPTMNESAKLAYEVLPAIKKLSSREISYSLQSQQRNTQFTHQIINDKRGCYR